MDARTNELDELIGLLTEWAEWMRAYSPNLGYPVRVPILSTGMAGIAGSSFDDLLDQVDNQVMRSIDASIDSLTPAQKAAIYRKYEICAVWRFPRPGYTYEQALSDGHVALLVTLKRKGVIIG